MTLKAFSWAPSLYNGLNRGSRAPVGAASNGGLLDVSDLGQKGGGPFSHLAGRTGRYGQMPPPSRRCSASCVRGRSPGSL